MPAGIWLTKFGVIVADYFGHVAFHVGSSLDRKDWRDVDVRLILPDDEFEQMFGRNQNAETNKKLAAVTLAFSALGKQMTGLPVDFQIQSQGHANERYPGRRSALIEVDEIEGQASGSGGPRDVSWLSETHWKLLGTSAHLWGWAALEPEEKAMSGTPARVSPRDCDRIVDAAVGRVREQIEKWAMPSAAEEPADA